MANSLQFLDCGNNFGKPESYFVFLAGSLANDELFLDILFTSNPDAIS